MRVQGDVRAYLQADPVRVAFDKPSKSRVMKVELFPIIHFRRTTELVPFALLLLNRFHGRCRRAEDLIQFVLD